MIDQSPNKGWTRQNPRALAAQCMTRILEQSLLRCAILVICLFPADASDAEVHRLKAKLARQEHLFGEYAGEVQKIIEKHNEEVAGHQQQRKADLLSSNSRVDISCRTK